MSTAAISSPALTSATATQNSKPQGAAPVEAFSTLYSQEVSQRQHAAGNPREADTSAAPKSGPEARAAAGDAESAAPAEAKEESEKTSDAAGQATPELLALMASAGELSPAAGKQPLATADVPSRALAGKQRRDMDAAVVAGAEVQNDIAEDGTTAAGRALVQDLAAGSGKIEPAGMPRAAPANFSSMLAQESGGSSSAAPAVVPLQQAVSGTTAGAASASLVGDRLPQQLGTPEWGNALGSKVVWMAGNGMESASLTLNPPDLGPLKVLVTVSNNQVSASFSAAQPEVRQAIESAMPKLRDMMAEAGIQLGQTSVGAGGGEQPGAPGQQSAAHRSDTGKSGQATPDQALPSSTRVLHRTGGTGLVDTFA